MKKFVVRMLSWGICLAPQSSLLADTVISEDFSNGPGCISNFDADVFFVENGAATVGTTSIRSGCETPPGGREYRHALCDVPMQGDFVLDVDLLIKNQQEFRAGIVYGWTDPHRYYVFHFNDYENGVLQLIRFDGVSCGLMLASPEYDSQREHWYHVRIEVNGDHHRVFVDGILQIDVTDSGYAGGQIGLSASFNGYGDFDNLVVDSSACGEWTEAMSVQAPTPRGHAAMSFHPDSGVVFFGGDDSSAGYLEDTWAWNGNEWTELPVEGPPAREQHAMVRADACGGVVLFGGAGEAGDFDDFWVWNGAVWAEIPRDPAPGHWPPARRAHAISYDPARQTVVLFGGVTNPCCPWPYFSDTWEWSCANQRWTKRSITGPSAREGHAMAYHPVNGVLLYGGANSCSLFSDTWAFDGSSWSLIAAAPNTVLPARSWTSMSFDSSRDRIVLFGGNDDCVGHGLNDTWEWDGQAWTMIHEDSPASDPLQRSRHVMEYDPAIDQIVLFGGIADDNVEQLGDTWLYHACITDCDDDGLSDLEDACVCSDMSAGLVINICDTGVDNQLLSNGCMMADAVAQCASVSGQRRAFVICLARLVRAWRNEGIITAREGSRILRCAVHPNMIQNAK